VDNVESDIQAILAQERRALDRWAEGSPLQHFEGYELVDPKVQVCGDVGIVTLRYEPFEAVGAPMQRWKATVVYRRTEGEWRVVHAHWSMVKES
jgi:ketosteroid isomerase-like protein